MMDLAKPEQFDLDRLAETPTLDDMRQMDSEAKLRLLAYCVASQITSLSFHSDRDRQLAQARRLRESPCLGHALSSR